VAKSFGAYAATYMAAGITPFYSNLFSTGVLLLFVAINLVGASMVARAENIIVIINLSALAIFTVASLFYIDPTNLAPREAPAAITIFYALGLTFFTYQGFSVITNSVEDMDDPGKTLLRSMYIPLAPKNTPFRPRIFSSIAAL